MTGLEQLEIIAKTIGILVLFFGAIIAIIGDSLRHVDLEEKDPNEEDA